jgi:hypothetical protein
VLTPPDGLAEAELAVALARGWGVTPVALDYRAVGWGSHHWEVADAAGGRWFATADELENKRHALAESLTAAFGRLRASLAAAVALRDGGLGFVLAPRAAQDGTPVVRANEGFSLALYPLVEGQSFDWGEFASAGQRQAVLEMLVAVHGASAGVRAVALGDDFWVPHRDELEAGLAGLAGVGFADCGPFGRPLAGLLAGHAAGLRGRLARYDELALRGRSRPERAVLTHGEPHPGNTMLTDGGWLLIDWDTVLVAPPERDLWSLDPGDGSVLAAYAEATGVTPRPELIELYRLRWDLADVAVDVSRFRRPHRGSAEDEEAWALLCSVVARLG